MYLRICLQVELLVLVFGTIAVIHVTTACNYAAGDVFYAFVKSLVSLYGAAFAQAAWLRTDGPVDMFVVLGVKPLMTKVVDTKKLTRILIA